MKLFGLFLVLWLVLCGTALGFDPPPGGDPWYYQSDTRLAFFVPDKVQHFWGSYALSRLAAIENGDIFGALAVLTLGAAWEIKDDQVSGVGFSYRDLIADGLGVVGSLVNRRSRLKMWVCYSTDREQITVNISCLIGGKR